jgi:SPP1 family predicted phage head-tail adaptor
MQNLTNRLCEPIIVQSQQKIDNQIGGYKLEWREEFWSWAYVESLFNKSQIGNEVAQAKEVISANFYQFTVRYCQEYDVKKRVIWRDRFFEITKILDTDPRKIIMQLITQEVIV